MEMMATTKNHEMTGDEMEMSILYEPVTGSSAKKRESWSACLGLIFRRQKHATDRNSTDCDEAIEGRRTIKEKR